MKERFMKFKALILVSVIVAFVFGMVCVDKHLNTTATHAESFFMSCAGESDAPSCTTTHQLLGNLVILGSLFLFLLISIIGYRYITDVFARFPVKKYCFVLFSNISDLVFPFRHNYLAQAFSSGILNPRLYN